MYRQQTEVFEINYGLYSNNRTGRITARTIITACIATVASAATLFRFQKMILVFKSSKL